MDVEGMNEMHGQYEWTESGLRLLKTIQEIIHQNGGEEEMHAKVFIETTDNSYLKNKASIKSIVRELKKSRVKHSVIIEALGLTSHDLSKVVSEIRTAELNSFNQERSIFKGRPQVFIAHKAFLKDQVTKMRLENISGRQIAKTLEIGSYQLARIVKELETEKCNG